MRLFVACAVAVLTIVTFGTSAAVAAAAADEGDQDAWSEASNGLRARLGMRRSHVSNGTGIVVTYLELNNVSDIGNPMLVTVDAQSIAFRVTDADGRAVPIAADRAVVRQHQLGRADVRTATGPSVRVGAGLSKPFRALGLAPGTNRIEAVGPERCGSAAGR